jgi:hypothetical protein
MGRKPIRRPDQPRFAEGDRVAWKSGKAWKRGTVLKSFDAGSPEDRKKAAESISPDYKLGKARKTPSQKKESGGFSYLVAEDSPLFQPGRTACSVPENHLQDLKETWVFKEEVILTKFREGQDDPRSQTGRALSLAVARSIHLKEKVPSVITSAFAREFPEIAPSKKEEPKH